MMMLPSEGLDVVRDKVEELSLCWVLQWSD